VEERHGQKHLVVARVAFLVVAPCFVGSVVVAFVLVAFMPSVSIQSVCALDAFGWKLSRSYMNG